MIPRPFLVRILRVPLKHELPRRALGVHVDVREEHVAGRDGEAGAHHLVLRMGRRFVAQRVRLGAAEDRLIRRTGPLPASVRLRTGEDLGARPVAEFVAMLEQVVKSRTLGLVP